MSLTVIDASVFLKLFLEEPDRDQAVALFRHLLSEGLPFGAPALLKLEACQCALHYDFAFARVLDLLDKYTEGGFEWVTLTRDHWALAETISRDGSSQAGYPGLIDALYHACAIRAGGVFVTADRRYADKAAGYGGVVMLGEYSNAEKNDFL